MNTNDRGNNKGSKDSILLRVRVSFVAALLLAAAIVYKIVDIQYVNGEKWMKKAQESSLRFMEVTPTRGNILSDDGTLLATSIPFFKVAIDPVISSEEVFTAGIDSLSSLLAAFFKEGTALEYKEDLLADRLAGKRYRLLSKKQITYQDKKEIEKWPIFKEGRMKGGVVFEKHETRFRPFASLGKRVIGFVKEDSTDDIRGRGLEYSFNDVLGGGG